MDILIRNGTLVTMNKKREVFRGDLLIENHRIKKIAPSLAIDSKKNTKIIDATDQFVIPGLIQVHTHTCQTLFRGLADDMPLLEWLKNKIWPMEAAHNENSMRASCKIALLEMQKAGTTTILDMGSTLHTDAIFGEALHAKMRYVGGNCWMDLKGNAGPLYVDTKTTLQETEKLIQHWHEKNNLIEFAISPRFVVSCTEKILLTARELQKQYGLLLHTHASENQDEVKLIKKRTGYNNVDYLARLGLINHDTVIVHGVHLTKNELKVLIKNKASLVHCPSSNLKLASGIAPIEAYLNAGLNIGLGADGAPCNNTLDPFMEMRLAALIQKPIFGAAALSAEAAFEIATLGGARVLKKSDQLGSLEVGKFADIVTVDRNHPSVYTVDNAYSALVYSCSGRDVKNVLIHGEPIILKGEHQIYDEQAVLSEAKKELAALLRRV